MLMVVFVLRLLLYAANKGPCVWTNVLKQSWVSPGCSTDALTMQFNH